VNASKVRELGDGEGSAFGAARRQVVKYLCALFAMVAAELDPRTDVGITYRIVGTTYRINDEQIVTLADSNTR
jgi:hypothetical protein